ncbi:MAG: CBS domain-containing protein [Lewinellaceae bacterium]|nr:CBS domain-containing protein [Lewinellaceae bacterium]
MFKTLHVPIAEIMTRELFIVQPEDKLNKVSEIFEGNNLHHVPVVDGHGKLVGIVSKSDFNKVTHLLTLFDEERYRDYNAMLYRTVRVEQIMTRQVATLSPDDPLTVAADIFMENLFHALPVVEAGVLVGLVTTHDLLSYCCSETNFLDR